MKALTQLALSACVLAAMLAVGGCANSLGADGRPLVWGNPHAASDTFSEAAEDHYRRVQRIHEQDKLGLIEDLDLFFMTERTGRLTRWHSR